MKSVIVRTTEGPAFAAADDLVLIVGTGPDKLTVELSEGDIVLYKGKTSPIKLEHVIGALCEDYPGYREARKIFFAGNAQNPAAQTTMLRYDLIYSIARARPDFFSSEELESLEGKILRLNGMDFSSITIRTMERYIDSLFLSRGIKRSIDTYLNWIKGETIHPGHHEDSALLANALNITALTERDALAQKTPKRENPYFLITDAHRLFTSRLRSMREHAEHDTNHKTKKSPLHTEGRVYEEFPGVFAKLYQRFEPMFTEKIIEATVEGVELIDSTQAERAKSQPGLQAVHGPERGLVKYDDEGPVRSDTYKRLHITEPEKRSTRLNRNLDEIFEIYERLVASIEDYGSVVQGRLIGKLLNSAETRPGSMFAPDIMAAPFSDAVQIKTTSGSEGAASYSAPSHNSLRFLSPLYEYNPMTMVDVFRKWLQTAQEVIGKREARRNYLRGLEKALPEADPFYLLIHNFYNSSMMLQSLYPESEFIKIISSDVRFKRATDVALLGNNNDAARKNLVERAIRSYDKHLSLIQEFIGMADSDIHDFKDAANRLPTEITLIWSMPYMRIVPGYESVGVPERKVLYEVLNRHKLDPADVMARFERSFDITQSLDDLTGPPTQAERTLVETLRSIAQNAPSDNTPAVPDVNRTETVGLKSGTGYVGGKVREVISKYFGRFLGRNEKNQG